MDENNIKKLTPGAVSLTEHLSALLDDETGSFEQRRVLDDLKSNDDLRQKLSSYALIGEVMRTSEATVTADSSFLAGIHAQIESEDEYHQVQLPKESNESFNDKRQGSSSWLRPVGGFAIAASVAAIAFFGIQNYQQSNTNMLDAGMASTVMSTVAPSANDLTEEKMATAKVAPATVSEIPMASVAKSDVFQQADARTRMLLKPYVDSHMQYASNTAFLPSVRSIAYAN